MREVEEFYPVWFDGYLIPLNAFWELLTFGCGSLWLGVALGCTAGFISFKYYTKQWNKNFFVIAGLCFFTLVFLANHKTYDTIQSYKDNLADEYEQYKSLDEWVKNNPVDPIGKLESTKEGKEWLKNYKWLEDFNRAQREEITIKIAHHFLFFFFSIFTFIFCLPQVKAFFANVSHKIEIAENNQKSREEQETSRIQSEKRHAENERIAREQRLLQEEQQQRNAEQEKIVRESDFQSNSNSEVNELIERAKRSQR